MLVGHQVLENEAEIRDFHAPGEVAIVALEDCRRVDAPDAARVIELQSPDK